VNWKGEFSHHPSQQTILHGLIGIQVCKRYTRAYLHTIVTKEAMGCQLISYHNVAYMMQVCLVFHCIKFPILSNALFLQYYFKCVMSVIFVVGTCPKLGCCGCAAESEFAQVHIGRPVSRVS
jgi:hypothetical protein